MTIVLEKASRVSHKGQTTIPAEVRQVLGVAAGDRVTFRIEDDRSVSVTRADEATQSDPAMDSFLSFLAKDIEARPSAVAPVTATLEARLRELTGGVTIDRENDIIEGDIGL